MKEQLEGVRQRLGAQQVLLRRGLLPAQRQPLLAVRALQWQQETLAMRRRALQQQESTAHKPSR